MPSLEKICNCRGWMAHFAKHINVNACWWGCYPGWTQLQTRERGGSWASSSNFIFLKYNPLVPKQVSIKTFLSMIGLPNILCLSPKTLELRFSVLCHNDTVQILPYWPRYGNAIVYTLYLKDPATSLRGGANFLWSCRNILYIMLTLQIKLRMY